jgi:transcriptional regulator of acetoin/glycerol metabolism
VHYGSPWRVKAPAPSQEIVVQAFQEAHIAQVMAAVGHEAARRPALQGGYPAPRPKDSVIQDSWTRCVAEHRLDPTRMQEAIILPGAQLREHQDQMEAFLHIARHGLEALYRQVAGLGYCVLLTDARGVTVDFLGDLVFEPSLRKAGLYLGADWSEHHAGTCGVGTCIATGQALTVHLDDHFDATHIPLTCTAAPVFDDQGRMKAVLDISALTSPTSKDSQHLALQMVKMYAAHVENASFLQRFREHWVLRLSRAPQFLDVNPEYLVALDERGCVAGHNRQAQLLLERAQGGAVTGKPLSSVLNLHLNELGHYMAGQPVDQRAVTLPGSREMLFLLAAPPPVRAMAGPSSRVTSPRSVPAPLAELSCGDPALDRLIERAARLVNSPVNILLTGETGSGKERLARALHDSSERRRQPFVAVNCAAIPESLIESELFGHLPGSFSGAGSRAKRGLIQEADGGTLLLDEIGDMPLPLQGRLLRVLAEREVLPVGATKPIAVNLRVVAATHCDLVAAVQAGRFRDDLYYRLNGAHFQLPPLRQRQDLEALIDRLCAHDDPPLHLSAPVRQRLLSHAWPGNVRELANVLAFARSLCVDGVVTLEDLPEHLVRRTPECPWNPWNPGVGVTTPDVTPDPDHRDPAPSLTMPAAGASRLPRSTDGSTPHPSVPSATPAAALLTALRGQRWNVSETARQLGVSRMTLYRWMKREGIRSPRLTDATTPATAPPCVRADDVPAPAAAVTARSLAVTGL